MDHAGRMKINLNEGYFIWNGTEEYYKRLRIAYSDIENDEIGDYTLFGFFTLCAATLEYSLNYILADYCFLQYGPKKCKTFIEAYISLSFRRKLKITPSIISNGELLFNEDHTSFKKLNELINLRNKVLHGKENIRHLDFSINDTDADEIQFNLEIEENFINKIDKESCLEYGNALGDLKKLIMEPWFNNELVSNDLLDQNQHINS